VVLPQGTHRVRFEFRPAALRRGAALSLLSLTLASAYLLLLNRRKHEGAMDDRSRR